MTRDGLPDAGGVKLEKSLWRKFLGLIVSLMMLALTVGKSRPESSRMRRLDFKTSGQLLGLRFNEKLRNSWRPRWLKLHR